MQNLQEMSFRLWIWWAESMAKSVQSSLADDNSWHMQAKKVATVSWPRRARSKGVHGTGEREEQQNEGALHMKQGLVRGHPGCLHHPTVDEAM